MRVAVAGVAVIALAACGSPERIRTLDGEPDLAHIDGTVPRGFSSSANEELHRLQDACDAVDRAVGHELPDVHYAKDVKQLALVDGQCQWVLTGPELIVGILAHPGGGPMLDQTATVIKGERSVAGVGDRAVLDPQTRTLYVVKNDRLWYLQLVGSAPSVEAPSILVTLGDELVQTHAVIR